MPATQHAPATSSALAAVLVPAARAILADPDWRYVAAYASLPAPTADQVVAALATAHARAEARGKEPHLDTPLAVNVLRAAGYRPGRVLELAPEVHVASQDTDEDVTRLLTLARQGLTQYLIRLAVRRGLTIEEIGRWAQALGARTLEHCLVAGLHVEELRGCLAEQKAPAAEALAVLVALRRS